MIMIMKRAAGLLAAAVSGALASVIVIIPSAHAAAAPLVAVTSAGVLKARAALEDDNDQFCLNIYNSGATADAYLRVYPYKGAPPLFTTFTNPNLGRWCRAHSPFQEGQSFYWTLWWHGANGSAIFDEGTGTY